ncbi:VOC family protein [Pontibacter vulgaris]|uniref:VOC family protein n=1 Tax=Pontibacter vulgaris TaxID=2905679 RepID=UPI001FA7B650|nr:VOC family protein [Pontibacter vulgaris]
MINQIFVNLPVQDLNKSKEFFTKLGFSINEQFTDETAACVVISETIYAMLLTHDKFKMFTPKGISDATKSTEVLTALSVNSKEEVDKIMEAALAAGGTEARPAEDLGFMYGRAFNDPDGHIWEVFCMDMSQMPQS